MAITPDQYLLYDTAVLAWAQSQFTNQINGKPTYFTIGTPDRGFAEYVTPTGLDPAGRPPLPRVAITLGDPEIESFRFNSNRVRKLGYTSANKNYIYNAAYPVPIKIPYTLNFWTEYGREMNLFSQTTLKQFAPGYLYFNVNVDSISPEPLWGTPLVGLYSEYATLRDSGEAEPKSTEKVLRRTYAMHLKCWLWDIQPQVAGHVTDVVTRFYSDQALQDLFEIYEAPQRFQLGSGDGVTKVFSFQLPVTPIYQGTLNVDCTIGGNNYRLTDNQSGVLSLIGPGTAGSSGTVDYSSGALTLSYNTAPDDTTSISAVYFTTIKSVNIG